MVRSFSRCSPAAGSTKQKAAGGHCKNHRRHDEQVEPLHSAAPETAPVRPGRVVGRDTATISAISSACLPPSLASSRALAIIREIVPRSDPPATCRRTLKAGQVIEEQATAERYGISPSMWRQLSQSGAYYAQIHAQRSAK